MRGAVVLAGGLSRRLGRPKALARVGGVPLLARVVRAASSAADDVVVATRGPLLRVVKELAPRTRVVRDRFPVRTPLAGLHAGARALRAEYVLALGCDLPFLRPRLLDALFRLARGHDAAIPRWPEGDIEPLVAVYRRSSLLAATRRALAAGERSNVAMVRRLRDVRYVDARSLRPFDRALDSFVNVNTRADLARARRSARSGARPRTR